ncbi:MAG: tetratricopeptide repeat protein [Thermodesulfobacteriota bacterium]|nr:tetratricopeptide repeat protein [Thermodesulfobacteriota bacterium]
MEIGTEDKKNINMVLHKKHFWICIGLAVITIAVYGRAVGHDFINMDDHFFVLEHNVPDGLTLENLKNAFTTFDCIWFPVTWLSHMTDAHLCGTAPAGHHLTSILLHLINVLLLFAVLRYITGAVWKSALVAVLFAIHPVNVETVAYIAARKELLCGLFWILGMGAYTAHTRHPSPIRYGLVVAAFILGGMANPIIMAFPLACLLLDAWPLDRIGETPAIRLFTEKIPLFMLALVVGLLALLSQQQSGAMPSIEMLPMTVRIANAVCAYGAYLKNLIYPAGLSIFYPYPQAFPLWKTAGATLVLLALTGTAICYRRRLPFIFFGWFWFILTLAPAIGIVKAGSHAMADRYAYISFIGLFIAIIWGSTQVFNHYKIKRSRAMAGTAAILVVLGLLSVRQLSYWKNSITIFEHALSVTSDNYTAHNNLGKALADRGGTAAARRHFEAALAIEPAFSMAHNNLGVLLNAEGKTETALTHFEKAVQQAPDLIPPRYNLGSALLARGRLDEAALQFREILKRDPGHPKATTRLALVYTTRHQYDKAIALFTDLLKHRPDYTSSIAYNLACLNAIKNDKQTAVTWLKKSINNGFSRFDLLFSDPDLENIHMTSYYKKLLEQYKP